MSIVFESKAQVVWADSCSKTSFVGRVITAPNYSYSLLTNSHSYPNGDIVVTGWIDPRYETADIRQYGLVMRLTDKGQPKWTKFIGYDGTPNSLAGHFIYSSTMTKNNEVVCVSQLNITKLDENGEAIWKRKLWPTQTGFYCEQIINTSDNGFLLVGNNASGTSKLIKLDSNGKLVWMKILTSSGYLSGRSIVETENNYYVLGLILGYPQRGDMNFISMVSKTTGNIVWSRAIHQTTNNGIWHTTSWYHDLSYVNGMLKLSGMTDPRINERVVQNLVSIDLEGKFVDGTRIQNEADFPFPFFQEHDRMFDHKTKTGVQYVDRGDVYAYRLDDEGTGSWQWRYRLTKENQIGDMHVREDGSAVFVGWQKGFNYIDRWQAQILKVNSSGRLENCDTRPFTLSKSSFLENIDRIDISTSEEKVDNDHEDYPIANGAGFEWNLDCAENSYCKISKINGPKRVCETDNPVYSVITEGNCVNSVAFHASPGVSIETLSDHSIRVRTASTKNFKIYVSLATDCKELKDSIEVSVTQNATGLNLGADTVICPGNVIKLSAQEEFASYTWNNGSTESFLTVTEPGMYSLTANDYCGREYKDEIKVAAFFPPAITLGPDRVKCNLDTVIIRAPPGFFSYEWQPDYKISETNSQIVVVNPDVDTKYRLIGEVRKGCFVSEEVEVKVNYAPFVNLGPDRKFCKGEETSINAGNNYVSYSWNTGQTSSSIIVSEKGMYSVKAESANGCVVQDSIEVLTPFEPPNVTLNRFSSICENQQLNITPGTDFRSYLWHDGSKESSLAISEPGIYWVNVIDFNGCTASDTAVILKKYNAPKDFLFADTTICFYDAITLYPTGSFKNYTWSTGSTNKQIQTNKSGEYWLRVTDENNCTGTDSISIKHKNCKVGIYFPSSFTPNGDGKNDQFRPTVFGPLDTFDLMIYNRFGNLVFRSNDPRKGWDGRIQGKIQNNDTFVWQCLYKWENDEPKKEKGTIVLVK